MNLLLSAGTHICPLLLDLSVEVKLLSYRLDMYSLLLNTVSVSSAYPNGLAETTEVHIPTVQGANPFSFGCGLFLACIWPSSHGLLWESELWYLLFEEHQPIKSGLYSSHLTIMERFRKIKSACIAEEDGEREFVLK